MKWGWLDFVFASSFLPLLEENVMFCFPPIIRNLLRSPWSFKAYQSGAAPQWHWPSPSLLWDVSQSSVLDCVWLDEVLPDSSSAKDNASLPQVLLPGSRTWESWADFTSKENQTRLWVSCLFPCRFSLGPHTWGKTWLHAFLRFLVGSLLVSFHIPCQFPLLLRFDS